MSKPLNEQIPLLEALEQQIDQLLYEGNLDESSEIEAVKCKYLGLKALGKYPQSHEAFSQYISKLTTTHSKTKAHNIVKTVLYKFDEFESIDGFCPLFFQLL